MNKEEIENILNKCNTCKIKGCFSCKTTYTERQQIREYTEQLENKVKDLERENKTLIHTNKRYKGMLDKQKREKQELIKYLKAKIDENK